MSYSKKNLILLSRNSNSRIKIKLRLTGVTIKEEEKLKRKMIQMTIYTIDFMIDISLI